MNGEKLPTYQARVFTNFASVEEVGARRDADRVARLFIGYTVNNADVD